MSGSGVDYSHWQCPPNTAHMPDVRRMGANGVEYVILKAWEGDAPDPNFKENLANAQRAGMPAMAYVYLHASDDADRKVACFDHIGDTVLCLDWEEAGVPASVVER